MAAPRLRTNLAAASMPEDENEKAKGKAKKADGTPVDENETEEERRGREEQEEKDAAAKAQRAAAADPVAADRARTKAITSSAHAKHFPALASHLAYDLAVSADLLEREPRLVLGLGHDGGDDLGAAALASRQDQGERRGRAQAHPPGAARDGVRDLASRQVAVLVEDGVTPGDERAGRGGGVVPAAARPAEHGELQDLGLFLHDEDEGGGKVTVAGRGERESLKGPRDRVLQELGGSLDQPLPGGCRQVQDGVLLGRHHPGADEVLHLALVAFGVDGDGELHAGERARPRCTGPHMPAGSVTPYSPQSVTDRASNGALTLSRLSHTFRRPGQGQPLTRPRHGVLRPRS